MCDKDTIRKAIIKGSIGKKKRHDVKIVMDDIEAHVDKIYNLLTEESFVPTIPKTVKIKDASSGKEREISIVPYYPDGIMHQLCVEVMRPVLMRGMYHWSCASIPGRGNMHAIKYVKRCMKKDRKGTKYCAKLDIHHYYPSISPKILIWSLARKIKDKKFLKLIYAIISSNPGGGLAIGYYINQWLANFLLEPLDGFICRQDGVKHYVRNMDDMIIFGPNKRKLHKAVERIREFLTRMKLELKGNWQVFPTDARGVDFVGYRFYHHKVIMRRRNFLKFTRQCRKARKLIAGKRKISFRTAAGLLSRAGQLKHCNGTNIRQKYFDGLTKELKSIVRQRAAQRTAENNGKIMVGCLRPSAV